MEKLPRITVPRETFAGKKTSIVDLKSISALRATGILLVTITTQRFFNIPASRKAIIAENISDSPILIRAWRR